jgi:hypothetical protein
MSELVRYASANVPYWRLFVHQNNGHIKVFLRYLLEVMQPETVLYLERIKCYHFTHLLDSEFDYEYPLRATCLSLGVDQPVV